MGHGCSKETGEKGFVLGVVPTAATSPPTPPTVEYIFEMEQTKELYALRDLAVQHLEHDCYEMTAMQTEEEKAIVYGRLLARVERLRRLQARIRFMEEREAQGQKRGSEDADSNCQRPSSGEPNQSDLPRTLGASGGPDSGAVGGCGSPRSSEPATLSGVVLGALGDSGVDSGDFRVS